MCGPLAALLARHPFKNLYFWGRIFSFTLVSTLAASTTLLFAFNEERGFLVGTGYFTLSFLLFFHLFAGKGVFPLSIESVFRWIEKKSIGFFLQKGAWGAFLFGASTALFPCGQSLALYSFSALSQDPIFGLFNGLLFSFLTTPALFLATKMPSLLIKEGFLRFLIPLFLGGSALLFFLRGASALGWISHFTVQWKGIHIMLF